MPSNRESVRAPGDAGRDAQGFTLPEANAALVLVRRIVSDIVRDYAEMLRQRSEREELLVSQPASPRTAELHRSIDVLVNRLNALHEELREIGCQLKDWSLGLVDFPAKHDGRQVSLCWKLGEERIGHWHEEHEGFANRREITSPPF